MSEEAKSRAGVLRDLIGEVRLNRKAHADPPQDVRAVMPGGSSFPVECVYRGTDENGIHRWVAVCPPPHFPVNLTIGVLPAHTSVAIEIRGD